MKINYTVRRSQDAWMVCEDLHDGTTAPTGKSLPRVTVMSVHARRHEAIDAARILAAGNMYHVDDAPAPEINHAQKAEFWAPVA